MSSYLIFWNVPKALSKIAQAFKLGIGEQMTISPEGTAENGQSRYF
jgi:hypothetical protein